MKARLNRHAADAFGSNMTAGDRVVGPGTDKRSKGVPRQKYERTWYSAVSSNKPSHHNSEVTIRQREYYTGAGCNTILATAISNMLYMFNAVLVQPCSVRSTSWYEIGM